MAQFINLTPHTINLNNGESLPASGTVARVSAGFSEFDENGVCVQTFGEVEGLPPQREGVFLVVSALVLAALKGSRSDVVAPATGHPACVRNDKGQVASVPGFVR